VHGGRKESSDEDIRGIRSGAGNERKRGNVVRVACIVFDKENPQDITNVGPGPFRFPIGTELDNRLESLGEGVKDVSLCNEAQRTNASTQFTCFIDEFNKLAL
jgi:hypothetical protein